MNIICYFKISKEFVWDHWIVLTFLRAFHKRPLSYYYSFPSELVIKGIMALKKNNSGESYENQMFLHLQQRFKNVPIANTLNMNKVKVKASNNSGCSIYPNILDLKYSNTYWQIFKNRSSTFHLYGAYFGQICLQNRSLKYILCSCFR